MIVVAVTFVGKCYVEALKKCETVDSARYIKFLCSMEHNFSRHVQPLNWQSIILIHDNARPHTSAQTSTFLQQKNVKLLHQPAYSPDFNMLDRHYFAQLENRRYTTNFANEDEVREYVTDTIRDLVKEDQQTLIASLLTDINNIIHSSGAYV